MDRWSGKVAVITGAAGGIGGAVYRALAKNGVVVVGLDKNLEKLNGLINTLGEIDKTMLHVRQCDVTIEEEIVNAFKWVEDELGGVDILVNSAGLGKYSRIIESSGDSLRTIMNVNVVSSAICIREAVASMKSRSVAGHIINLNSVFGRPLSYPTHIPNSLYSPSKYAITAMTEIVRKELNEINTKIKITSISPGMTKTGIAEAAGVPHHEKLFKIIPHIQPEDVADSILYSLGTPPNVQVTELTIRAIDEV